MLKNQLRHGKGLSIPLLLKTDMQTFEIVRDTVQTILSERDDPVLELKPETSISASGLDSLDIASLVVRLEERLGIDPFRDGTLKKFPQTLGEIADLYSPKR